MRNNTDSILVAGATDPPRRAVLAGVSFSALFTRVAVGQPTTAGQVQEVKGQVTAELASQTRVLVPRSDVFNGDDVATAASSRAAMLLGRDTTLRLGANARIKIDRFIVNAGGVLTLESGPLLLDKGPGNPAATVTVRGSFGLITVRGTRIFVGPSQGDRYLCRSRRDRCGRRGTGIRSANRRRDQYRRPRGNANAAGGLG